MGLCFLLGHDIKASKGSRTIVTLLETSSLGIDIKPGTEKLAFIPPFEDTTNVRLTMDKGDLERDCSRSRSRSRESGMDVNSSDVVETELGVTEIEDTTDGSVGPNQVADNPWRQFSNAKPKSWYCCFEG